MKKVGKTTRPFRYDLNQIPYDYRVGVMNRFEGFNLVDRVPEEIWKEVHIGSGNQNYHKEKEMHQGKVVV